MGLAGAVKLNVPAVRVAVSVVTVIVPLPWRSLAAQMFERSLTLAVAACPGPRS